MFPSLLFEIINATLTLLGLFVLLIFGRYMLIEWWDFGFDRVRMRAAIAVSVFVSGEVLTRGWTWWLRYLVDTKGDSEWLRQLPWGLIPGVGASIAAMGLLCIMRVFSPDDWGHKGWLVGAGLVSIFVLSTILLR